MHSTSTVSKGAQSARPSKHLPGEPGIWVFILGDMVIFGLFFLTFAVYRQDDPALYGQSHSLLNQTYGLVNTLILLTSSWLVAMAVHLAREGIRRPVVPMLSLALLCGVAFCGVKVLEYGEKISAGIVLTTNDFFMFYYMFTGIHLVHVLIGMVVLIFMVTVSRRPEMGEREIAALEGGGVFWHLVDLLWIVLFCLFYLVR